MPGKWLSVPAVSSPIASATSAYSVAATILAAVKTKLTNTPAGPPDRVTVVDGAIAWDDCTCGGGMLVIAPGRMYQTDQFPAEAFGAATPCAAAYLAVDYILQIIRCAPMLDAAGNPPSVRALDASAQTVMSDGYAALIGVSCTLPTLVDNRMIIDYAMRAQNFVGPEGGCVGSEILFAVSFLRQP